MKIKGRRVIVKLSRKMIRNDSEAEFRAREVVSKLDNNETHWGGFGRGPLLVVMECPR